MRRNWYNAIQWNRLVSEMALSLLQERKCYGETAPKEVSLEAAAEDRLWGKISKLQGWPDIVLAIEATHILVTCLLHYMFERERRGERWMVTSSIIVTSARSTECVAQHGVPRITTTCTIHTHTHTLQTKSSLERFTLYLSWSSNPVAHKSKVVDNAFQAAAAAVHLIIATWHNM